MIQEKPLDTSDQEYIQIKESDITLDHEWVLQNADRLLAYEILRRSLFMQMQEIPAEKLCDMIGMPYTYVWSIIKKAKKYAKR